MLYKASNNSVPTTSLQFGWCCDLNLRSVELQNVSKHSTQFTFDRFFYVKIRMGMGIEMCVDGTGMGLQLHHRVSL